MSEKPDINDLVRQRLRESLALTWTGTDEELDLVVDNIVTEAHETGERARRSREKYEQLEQRVAGAKEALAWHPDPSKPITSTRVFPADYEALRQVLVWAACPVVCRGYLDGDENWHQLCIDKADRALAVMEIEDL